MNIVSVCHGKGSGKTFTIGGANTAGLLEEEYGIVPRAAKQIFHIIEVHTVHMYRGHNYCLCFYQV